MAKPKWVDDIRSAFVRYAATKVIAALGGAVATVVTLYPPLKAVAGDWAPVVVGYLGFFTFAVVLLGINQYLQLHERGIKKAAAARTPTMVGSQIHDWLYGFRYEIKDESHPGAHFHMAVRDDQGKRIGVYQEVDRPWVTIATSTFAADDEYGKVVRSLLNDTKSTVVDDLTIELARLGVEFNVQGAPADRVTIEHKVIVGEAMTAMGFYHEIMLVRRGLHIAQRVLHRAAKGLSP